MSVAKPFVDARELLKKPVKTEKEKMEERIKYRLIALDSNIISYKDMLKIHEDALNVFIAEVENCMDETELKKLCSRVGI